MMAQYAAEEAAELAAVMPVIRRIPNASNYFLGADEPLSEPCQPAPLSPSDRMGFSRCLNLEAKGIKADNVNANLQRLRVINSPYGGVELERAWKGVSTMGLGVYTNGFKAVNNACRRLLKYGIVPLNEKGLLHGDVKDSNILVSFSEHSSREATRSDIEAALQNVTPREADSSSFITARLIDWGLVIPFTPGGRVPETLAGGRYLMYNAPMSIILLDRAVAERACAEVKKLGINQTMAGVGREGVMWNAAAKAYAAYRRRAGDHGHHDYLAALVGNVYAPLLMGPESTTRGLRPSHGRIATFQTVVVDYLAAVLSKYTSTTGECSKFMPERYFDEVYRWNADVYGLVMSYATIIDSKQYDGLHEWQRPLSNGVLRILVEYCFSPKYAAKRIPVDKLLADLGELNRVDDPGSARAEEERPPTTGPGGAYPRGAARRCKKGFQYRARDGMCVPRSAPTQKRRKRCPRGTRRNKEGQCVPK